MRIPKYIATLITLLAFATLPAVHAQVTVERSATRIIVSGAEYYIHTVKKGETAYSISRAYGITVEELVAHNPTAAQGIAEGEALRIPAGIAGLAAQTPPVQNIQKDEANYTYHTVRQGETAYSISRAYGITVEELVAHNPTAAQGIAEGEALRIPVSIAGRAAQTPPAQNNQTDEANYTYHTVRQGETVYSLSKQYNVSESDIVQSNSGINISKISIGTEIAIPRRKPATGEAQPDAGRYYVHIVKQGESLSSIARQYSVTVRELRRENRDARFLQPGDYVRIPGRFAPVAAADTGTEGSSADSLNATEELPPYAETELPLSPTALPALSGKLNVAVLLPFYFGENTRRPAETDTTAVRLHRENRKPDDWIYPASYDFVEMYEGILLAVDTLRSLGLDVNIYAHDIQGDTVALARLIRSGSLRSMNLIIGPVYSHNLKIVTEYARSLGIPVVSPVPLFNNSLLEGNPNLFMASPTISVAQDALAKKIAEYRGHNIIFIHADSLGVDSDVKRFRNGIRSELALQSPADSTRFRDMLFSSRAMGGTAKLDSALSPHSGNVVIIASEYAPVISETIVNVHGLSKRFDVKLFGYPLLRELENLEPRYFFDLDMLLYSTFWIDYSRPNVKQFNADYRTTFFTQPSEISYAWQGYDIAYYFISGLALHGNDFLRHPSIHRPELLHTDFMFVRKDATDGFENHKLFPIRHTKDFNIVLENDTNP